jgi:hypothetical protein
MRSPPQEADRLPTRRLALVVAALVAAAVLGIVVSRAMQRGRYVAPTLPARAEIGVVEQSLILSTERGIALRDEQSRELGRFGWVDVVHGVASIPIDRAMQIVVERGP